MLRSTGIIAAAACGLWACSPDPASVVIDVTPGHETGAFSEEPPITRVDVVGASPEGDILLGASTTPGGTFALGEIPDDRLLQFDVTGFDGTSTVRVRGRSLSVVLGAVEAEVLPIFAQRLGGWSRPPGGTPHSHVGGVAGVLGERYLLLTGGATVDSDRGANAPAYYDLLGLTGADGADLPRAAATLVMGADGVSALLVSADGSSHVDYNLSASSEISPPAGLESFAEVAGGAVVTANDGTSYVVGGTRLDAPSDAILVWSPGQDLSLARLNQARQGAAAVWLDTVGLVVAGGSDEGAGVEVLSAGATTAVARTYPADPVRGAAGLARNSGQVVLLGGHEGGVPAPARLIDTGCTGSGCESQTLDIDIAVALERCQLFTADADHGILVGADIDEPWSAGSVSIGRTRTFAVNLIAEDQVELELRERRAGATALATPHGLLAVLGGMHEDGSSATTVEMLVPSEL